jgi:hypothetical protein
LLRQRSTLAKPDPPVGAQGPAGVVGHFPRMAVRVDEDARVSAPECPGRLAADATVLGLPVAVFPAINAERFGGGAQTLGLLTAAIGVGGLAGSACSGPVAHIARPGRAMLWTVTVWGAAIAGFAVAHRLWLALGLHAVAGAADTTTVVLRGTIVQAAIPDQLRGRITAADYVVGAGGGELGSLEAGAVGSLASPTISALSGGLATIAGVILLRLALPSFARYNTRQPARTDLPNGEGEHPASA